MRVPDAVEDAADRQEQRRLHDRVVDDVEDRGGEPRLAREADADDDVADLRDAREGEHAPQVGLEHGDDRHRHERGDPRRQQHAGQEQLPEAVVRAEDPVEEAEQDVERDLGGRSGEEGGHRDRREMVGVDEPGVQREHRRLDHQPDGQEAERDEHGALGLALGNALGEIDHVQRAGGGVQEPDADQDEARPDAAEHEVAEARRQSAPIVAEREQHVGRERGDLEEDEDVERVAGDRDAEKSRHAEQPRGVEEVELAGLHPLLDGRPRVEEDHRADRGDEHEHRRVQRVDVVLDAGRRRPAADGVADRAGVEHLPEQPPGDEGGGRVRRERDPPRRPGAAHQHADGGRHQRDDDLQRGQLRGEPAGLAAHVSGSSASIAFSSSSSIVPNASWMRTVSASATAVVATPTTIAVRISTCGNGFE